MSGIDCKTIWFIVHVYSMMYTTYSPILLQSEHNSDWYRVIDVIHCMHGMKYIRRCAL